MLLAQRLKSQYFVLIFNPTIINAEFVVVVGRKEFSSSAVRRPINVDALTKWAEHISYDLRPDVGSIAPMLDMLGYDVDKYPPDYTAMTYRAESLLRQAASRDHDT